MLADHVYAPIDIKKGDFITVDLQGDVKYVYRSGMIVYSADGVGRFKDFTVRPLEHGHSAKPDWFDFPEWAEWLCQDENGAWHISNHEPRPAPNDSQWQFQLEDNGVFSIASKADGLSHPDWRHSLERRPIK
jgi:hypothetical protein